MGNMKHWQHWKQVIDIHICILNSPAYSAPSHYLNQRRVIVNWTFRNKLQWNFNQNTKFFIHENAYENIVCEMAAILSRGGGEGFKGQN